MEVNDFIRKNHHHHTISEIATELGLGESTVYRRIKEMDLPSKNDRFEEEDAYIVEHYLSKSASSIAKDLGWNKNKVLRHAKKLGLGSKKNHIRTLAPRDYSESEIVFMSKSVGLLTIEQVAAALGRSVEAIKVKAKRLGIRFNPVDHYTPEEDQFLRNNYRKLSYAQIGEIIGRTQFSVHSRAKYIGITRPKEKALILPDDTPEELKLSLILLQKRIIERREELPNLVDRIRS